MIEKKVKDLMLSLKEYATISKEETFKEIHDHYSSSWSQGIMGFCVNRTPFMSSIFVKNAPRQEEKNKGKAGLTITGLMFPAGLKS